MATLTISIIKKNVDAITLNRSAPIEHRHSAITRYRHHRAKGKSFVGCDEPLARPDSVSVGRDSVGGVAATLSQVQGQ